MSVRAITLADKANDATVTISGGNLNPAMPALTITLAPSNIVTVAPGTKFAMHVTARTGLFGGSFTLPGATKPIAFAGALFQKLDANGFGSAAGLFIGAGQTGSIDLAPIP
jgi:hypothetical protein